MFNVWLIATAFANPLVVDLEPSIGTDPRIPWGPREFNFDTESTGTHQLDPRALYNLVSDHNYPHIYHHKTLINCGAPFWCSGKN